MKEFFVKITIKEEAAKYSAIKKFVGRTIMANVDPKTGHYLFQFFGSTGLTGPVIEKHRIPPHLAEIVKTPF